MSDSYSTERQLQRPDWLEKFQHSHNRPLRILHFGNIANNAYMNAKIMRQIGIHADVVCPDYYHAMGTPEWEDARFTGEPGDLFFPDWWRLKSDFVRPDWFFQGPKRLCQTALKSQFSDVANARNDLDELNLATYYICFRDSNTNGARIFERSKRNAEFLIFLAKYFARRPKLIIPASLEIAPWLASIAAIFRMLILIPTIFIASILSLLERVGNILAKGSEYFGWRFTLLAMNLAWKLETLFVEKFIRPIIPFGSNIFRAVTGRNFSDVFGRTFVEVLQGRQKLRGNIRLGAGQSHTNHSTTALSINDKLHVAKEASAYFKKINRHSKWASDYQNWHKKISHKDYISDSELAMGLAEGWEAVFVNYDIVQCYSTDGIVPMAIGKENYFCYEHGTLRTIPFENSSVGRLTAAAYRGATGMIVTNLDTLGNLAKLAIPPSRAIYLPAPLDDHRYSDFAQEHSRLRPDRTKPVRFFSAARQHWLDKDMNYAKGNDIFLRAFAKAVPEHSDATITLVEWGRDVEATKKLLLELGIEERVTWLQQMKIEELWKQYLMSHAVVDQFIIPAFGRVTFDSLMLGKRVISNLDKTKAKQFFGEIPPMMIAANISQATAAISRVLNDPNDDAGIGEKSFDWAMKYHSSQRVLDLQLDAYRPLFAGEGDDFFATQVSKERKNA